MRWLLAWMMWVTFASAQSVPDYQRITVTDHADLLTAAEEDALHDRLTDLRKSTGVELAVLTLPAQEPFAPDISVEAFAALVFDDWGIGNADRNDGILFLVLSEDRAVRIELGAGYGRDWDRVAAEILNRSVLPAFETGDFAQGINAGVTDVTDAIIIPFRNGDAAPAGSDTALNWVAIVAFLGAGLILLRRKLGRLALRLKRCPNCGQRGLSLEDTVHHAATGTEPGKGERVTRCSQCAYQHREHYRIASRNNRSKATGRGGFGGGRSGGGGASARW